MVGGELHIAAVDYEHTHHPYFCIVKHRDTGLSQESLPFHLTLRGGPSSEQPILGSVFNLFSAALAKVCFHFR